MRDCIAFVVKMLCIVSVLFLGHAGMGDSQM
jgi:hypothetical protein